MVVVLRKVPLLKPPGNPAVLQTVLLRDMPRSHSKLPPTKLTLERAQTEKPLLPTRNALAKAGSPDECAAATSKAAIAAGGIPEKPPLLPTRKALAKGGSRDEYATAAVKACLADGSSPQAGAAMRTGMKVRIQPLAQQMRHISPSLCGTDQLQDSGSDGGQKGP